MMAEKDLETRLANLPDAYPGFARAAMFTIDHRGLVDDILSLLDEAPGATTEDVIAYEWLRCGLVDRYAEDGARVPVPCDWLSLTSGMRGILADMKSKTLKSYQLALAGSDGMLADCSVRLNLGQHAVDLDCHDFAFDMGGQSVDLGAMRCERMSLRDDFGADPDLPVRAYVVGERITGVELATDHVDLAAGISFDVDVAVAVKTAHAVYTFSRESWAATGIRVIVENGLFVPAAADELNGEWLRAHPELGTAKVTRSIAKLA